MTTTISWPSRLPLPTFEGMSVEPQDACLRTEMEAGPARTRRRFTQVPTRIPVRWRFGPVDFATFEAWFRLKLGDGAEWFSIGLLGGIGMVAHEARFVGQSSVPYKAVPSRGGVWIVTSILEIRERPMLDEGALDIILDNEPTALFGSVDGFHDLIHSSLSGPLSW